MRIKGPWGTASMPESIWDSREISTVLWAEARRYDSGLGTQCMSRVKKKKASWAAILEERLLNDSRFLMGSTLLIYGHRTHPSHEEPSTRVLPCGQAKNDTPPKARTEESAHR
jgi:hypothetical protein